MTNDSSKLPFILNNFFATVGENYAKMIPKPRIEFTEYLKSIDQPNSLFFAPVIKTEIENEISALACNMASGLYSCPVTLLKASKHVLSEHLAKEMNLSVQTGRYPTKLKISKVFPIFKSDDDTDPSNYRTISLLSIFNRIFEKTMFNRLTNFVEKNQLLSDVQYDFRKYHSTHRAILDIVNSIQSNMDQKVFTCAIFIDLAKAFDTVEPTILLKNFIHME